MKKVLLMVVDACNSRVIIPAMDAGKLPAFQKLRERGIFRPECFSVFPSITPAATCSIVTGTYPQEHGIIGAFWYDKSHDEVAYYGDDFWVILKRGLGDFFEDFLIKLNHERLDAKTIFERVELAGMRAASINYMIYHGINAHEPHVPFWMNLASGLDLEEKLMGPSIMMLGDFVSTEFTKENISIEADGGPFNRYGFRDEFTRSELLELVKAKLLPEISIAYFPDNDYVSHHEGPANSIKVLEEIDSMLEEIFSLSGGVENFLCEYVLLITGDHSQSDIINESSGLIALDEILEDFPLVSPGDTWDTGERVMICPNLRSAQLYFRNPGKKIVEQTIARLLQDERIDQVIWRENLFHHRDSGFHVATARHGELHFQAANNASTSDEYGGQWKWEGNISAVDGIQEGKKIFFGDYPNAFERIAAGLSCENSGQLWLTAKIGYECGFGGDGFHEGGGSHGTLHSLDSTAPLFIAGAPEEIFVPEKPRIVDIAGIIYHLLGLSSPHQVGGSHIRLQK